MIVGGAIFEPVGDVSSFALESDNRSLEAAVEIATEPPSAPLIFFLFASSICLRSSISLFRFSMALLLTAPDAKVPGSSPSRMPSTSPGLTSAAPDSCLIRVVSSREALSSAIWAARVSSSVENW